MIDNGNHLVLSGNHAIHAYLSRIYRQSVGAVLRPVGCMDLKSGARWTREPNDGPLPWWIKRRRGGCRIQGQAIIAYAKLLFAGRRKVSVM